MRGGVYILPNQKKLDLNDKITDANALTLSEELKNNNKLEELKISSSSTPGNKLGNTGIKEIAEILNTLLSLKKIKY